jgi:hypothetical protein
MRKYVDGGGLALLVSPIGSKSWVFRFERKGRDHRAMVLGPLHGHGGAMVRLLENEREAANRGGLSCFYGHAVSLTLRSAIMESGEFLPESTRHDGCGVYRAKSRNVSETRARMRSRSRSRRLPPPAPGFQFSS